MPVCAGTCAEQLALFETAQERALGKRSGVLDFDAARRHLDRHRVTVVGRFGGVFSGLGLVAEREVGDVGDRARRFVDPMRMHPRPGADRVGTRGSDINGVQQRDVGTVELDQRPGERPVQRLPLQGFGLPGPRQHGPDTGHRYDLGQSFVGHGVELGGRDIDPAIRAPDTDDASLTQGGEELAEGGSD